MNYEQKFIEIPFGANDSELKGWEYTIPEGMEAIVKDGKVIVKEKESEDDRIRKEMIDFLKSEKAFQTIDLPISERWISYLEKQKPQDQCVDVIKMSALLAADRLASAEMTGRLKERKEILENPEKFGLCKPAEWGEEDELMRKRCIVDLGYLTEYEPQYKERYDAQTNWLKSLRPSWKPSEEQMEERKFKNSAEEYDYFNPDSKI